MNNVSSHKIVLIVEDSEACSVVLQVALESLPNVELRFAPSASTALRLLDDASVPFAALITDVQMPGMSGLELLARLRSQDRFSNLPVLMISGDSNPLLPKQAISRGADAFFTKPYSPSEVRKRLEQLIS